MEQATHEALSAIEKTKPVTKQDVLKLIPQFEIPPFFWRNHLRDREVVIGTTGEKGGGKSGTDAVIVTTDCSFKGKTIFSNMSIKVSINIDDAIAMKYGLNSGGIAKYESQPLEKDALLRLDERYHNNALLIEEINVGYSNVRRVMSNTNVDFDQVVQQLRKLRCPLYYNVIDEMFIDPQLRSMTDAIIKTYDTAFDLDSLEAEKPMGIDFCWYIYPLTGLLYGQQRKYALTHRAIGPLYFHFQPWRGIYDSNKSQEQGIYTMSTKDKNKMLLAVQSDSDVTQVNDQWGWLVDIVRNLRDRGVTVIPKWALQQEIGQNLTQSIKDALGYYGVHWDAREQAYVIENYKLETPDETHPLRHR